MKSFGRLSVGGALLLALVPACEEGGPDDAAVEPGTGPLYAMMTHVYGPEDRTVYVSLSDTVDIDSIDLETAQEFPSVANMAAIDGRILISDGQAPKILEYEISDDFDWIPGRELSFSGYPLPDNANFYYQFIVDDEHALMPFNGTSRILWNPKKMEIEDDLTDSSLKGVEKGLTLEAGGNREGIQYEGPILQAFYYHDDDWFDYGSTSHLVVYDEKTFEETKVLDIPCPALTMPTLHEDGGTYWGTWDLPTSALVEEDGTSCIVKVTREGELEETIDLREWTDGHAVNNFRYIGDGKAVGNVFYHEEFGVDSPAELDAEALDLLWEEGPHWKVWLFDTEKGGGKPVKGIDVDFGAAVQFAVLDGRTFLFVPYDDWSRTKGYELNDNGAVTEVFDTLGDVFKWVKVR